MIGGTIKNRPRLRLLRRWGRLKPGDIITPLTGARRTSMIRNGIAELVEQGEPETATADPGGEEARFVPPTKRKRGRPRKYPAAE